MGRGVGCAGAQIVGDVGRSSEIASSLTLSRFASWGGRSTTPLGPTLPSLVTAREYRSYCDLLYVHQVLGHGWARRATSSRGRRHVKCSGRWLCSNQRRRLK